MASPNKSDRNCLEMRSNTRRHTRVSVWFLLVGASLVANGAIQLSSANAASSEVWSEADGVQLKYSTNHDDLLSTKGSELSLSTDQNQQHHRPASGAQNEGEGATGGEESTLADKVASANVDSTEPAAESPASPSDDEQSGSGDGEQRADSRQSEKVHPAGGKVQSYSSSNQQSFKSSHRTPVPVFSHGHQEAGSSSGSQHSFRPGKAGQSKQRDPESSEHSEAGGADEGPSGDIPGAVDAEEMSGASSSDDRPSKGSYGASKFRQPSRMFKEAVRMNAAPSSKASADEESPDDSGDESGEKAPKSSATSDAGESEEPANQQQAQDEAAHDNDELSATSGQAPAKSGRQNLMDFDQFPSAPLRQSLDVDRGYSAQDGNPMMMNQFEGPSQPVGPLMVNQEDESSDSHHFRPPFYDSSVQSSRGSLAASTPHKKRVLTPAHFTAPRQQSQQQGQSSPLPGQQSSEGAPSAKNPQAYKQLSYFKNVKDQQSGVPTKPTFSSFRTSAAADESESPDSVRDNFISPGHFPGSMPHLTQAASEVDADKSASTANQATATVSNSSPDSSAPVASSSDAVNTVVVGKPEQPSSQEAVANQDKNDANKQPRTAESNEVAALATVTPLPEAQQESQQIMAPILLSTTTMAPLLPTSTTPTSTSTTSAPSSTSETPSLKRFKFRKYR